MPLPEKRSETDPFGIIARSLSFLCLVSANLRDEGIVPQAELLQALGVKRPEIAEMLGTTERSLSELLSRKRRKKGTRAKGKQR
jgi:CRP-like cAMP-binding protein